MRGKYLGIEYILPKGELIGFVQEIIDMIRIWKVFGRVISVGEEQVTSIYRIKSIAYIL